MMRRAAFLVAVFTAALVATTCRGGDAERPRPPNVLFLFADDQRADTIAAWGNPRIRTPNLDRLVRSGISFRRAYMQGAFGDATCVASRAMLLSGRSLFHTEIGLLRDETWPAAFGRAGYETFMTGKWHNGAASLPLCFQQARSVFVGGFTNPLKAVLTDVDGGRFTLPRVASQHACAVFADEAIRVIRLPHDKPFFCYVAFDAPHDPHIVPENYPLKYDPAKMSLPGSYLPAHPFDNGDMEARDELLLPRPRTPQAVQQMLADYYRYISYLDEQIGRVLDALDDSPDAKNTIVVFAADSGVARGSHGLIGKQNLYELDSIRVPLVIAGPGIPANKSTDAMCYLFDVLPTLGARCKVVAPPKSEGIDVSATLRDPAHPAREQMLFAYRNVQRAIVMRDWKLIGYPQVNRIQLFHLSEDPEEIHDLAGKAESAPKMAELLALLKKEMAAADDNDPRRGGKAPIERAPARGDQAR
jgi:arylsulfatase A-like enzyme